MTNKNTIVENIEILEDFVISWFKFDKDDLCLRQLFTL